MIVLSLCKLDWRWYICYITANEIVSEFQLVHNVKLSRNICTTAISSLDCLLEFLHYLVEATKQHTRPISIDIVVVPFWYSYTTFRGWKGSRPLLRFLKAVHIRTTFVNQFYFRMHQLLVKNLFECIISLVPIKVGQLVFFYLRRNLMLFPGQLNLQA